MSYKFTALKENEFFFLGTDMCQKKTSTTFVVREEAFMGERMWEISMEPNIFTLKEWDGLTFPKLAVGEEFKKDGVRHVKRTSIHYAKVDGPGLFKYDPKTDAFFEKLAVQKPPKKRAVKKAAKAKR